MEITVKKKNLRNILIGIIILVVIVGGIYFMAGKSSNGNGNKVILETRLGQRSQPAKAQRHLPGRKLQIISWAHTF